MMRALKALLAVPASAPKRKFKNSPPPPDRRPLRYHTFYAAGGVGGAVRAAVSVSMVACVALSEATMPAASAAETAPALPDCAAWMAAVTAAISEDTEAFSAVIAAFRSSIAAISSPNCLALSVMVKLTSEGSMGLLRLGEQIFVGREVAPAERAFGLAVGVLHGKDVVAPRAADKQVGLLDAGHSSLIYPPKSMVPRLLRPFFAERQMGEEAPELIRAVAFPAELAFFLVADERFARVEWLAAYYAGD